MYLRRVAAATCTWDFHSVIRFRVAAHTMSEKAIRFRHPDYNPDLAQKLISISSYMSRHLLTRNISSKSMHTFLSNLAHRQTDRQRRAKTFTSYFVGGNSKKVSKKSIYIAHRCETSNVLNKLLRLKSTTKCAVRGMESIPTPD